MAIKFFEMLGAKKYEGVKRVSPINKNRKASISMRNRKDGRKEFAIILDKSVIQELKWKKENLRVDFYVNGQGCGLSEEEDGQYALSARKKKNGEISSYEVKIRHSKEICSEKAKFSSLPVDLTYHEEKTKKFLWFTLPNEVVEV